MLRKKRLANSSTTLSQEMPRAREKIPWKGYSTRSNIAWTSTNQSPDSWTSGCNGERLWTRWIWMTSSTRMPRTTFGEKMSPLKSVPESSAILSKEVFEVLKWEPFVERWPWCVSKRRGKSMGGFWEDLDEDCHTEMLSANHETNDEMTRPVKLHEAWEGSCILDSGASNTVVSWEMIDNIVGQGVIVDLTPRRPSWSNLLMFIPQSGWLWRWDLIMDLYTFGKCSATSCLEWKTVLIRRDVLKNLGLDPITLLDTHRAIGEIKEI